MANINAKTNGEELILSAEGRIDSTNAGEIEVQVKNAVAENAHTSVVLDLENLEYISSAGLRIILRLRKDEPTLKIIGASSDVYEIFDMTGFTEMMPIEKAYRKVSVEGCEVIGKGANGIVYRIDPDTIVKYYFQHDALPDIHRERELARKAFVLGIPTAIPYDVVKVGDGYGSVFELLNADSFLKLIQNDSENIDKYIALSVDVMKKMHATDVDGDTLPSQRAKGIKWAETASLDLPEATSKKLKAMFEAIPESKKMNHGDYHIKNIMLQNGEVLLIDMDTLCTGNPIFELAGMFNAYMGYAATNHNNTEEFFGISYETGKYIWEKTLEMYLGTDNKELIELTEKKASLIGFTRLMRRTNNFPEERQKFYTDKVIELTEELDSLAL